MDEKLENSQVDVAEMGMGDVDKKDTVVADDTTANAAINSDIVTTYKENDVGIKKKSYFVRHKKLIIFITCVLAVVSVFTVAFLFGGGASALAVADFITSQLLGMKWLNDFIGWMFTVIFGSMFQQSVIGAALQFFLYDTIKIITLLCALIFIISYIQSYFPPERTKKILSKFNGIGGNIMGALLGTVTPFCSCSSIPLFIGFTRAKIPTGVTFSFLISSPLVDIGAFILLASVFGFPIAVSYVAVGLVLAVVGGTIVEKTGLGKSVKEFVIQGSGRDVQEINMTRRDRLIFSREQMLGTLKKVWLFILIGVGIGAAIHNIIPAEWTYAALGDDKWYSVLIASVVGIPMYADIFGTIPIAEALLLKGVGVGTILSFMMSVTALSLPSIIMLSKVVKTKLLIWFVVIVTVGIIAIGYTFNALNFLFI